MDSPIAGEFILNNTTANTPAATVSHPHPTPPEIKQKALGAFTSLCIDPQGVEVINQEADEYIHLIVRRDFITNVPWIAFLFVMILAPLFIPLFLSVLPFTLTFTPTTVVLFLLLYYLSLFGYTLLKFSEWYFNAGLITNKRVVDVDMYNILSRNVAETPIQSVVEVTYTQKGVLQSVFNYGNVFVLTESREQNFEFDRVPHPSQVAEIISELAEEYGGGKT